jgi:hypothetical protein
VNVGTIQANRASGATDIDEAEHHG